MIWGDLLLRTAVEVELLRAALGLAFNVAIENVFLVTSVENRDASSRVVVEIRELKGEFSLYCCVYLFDLMSQREPIDVALSMAGSLATDVLISDDTPDPYTMILARRDGLVEGVSVDVEALDERGEYMVVR